MKVAIIADIHGNAVALQTALSAIEEESPDRIICLGDVVANGPQPSESLDIVRELDCPMIQGTLTRPSSVQKKSKTEIKISSESRISFGGEQSNCRTNR